MSGGNGVGRSTLIGVAGVVGLATLVVLPRWNQMVQGGIVPPLGVLIVIITLNSVANLLLAENWHALAGLPGRERPAAYRVFALGQLARYLVPGGNIPGRAALARRYGLPLRQGIAIGVLDLLLAVSALSLAALATVGQWLAVKGASTLALLAVVPAVVCLAVLIAPAQIGRMSRRLGGLLPARMSGTFGDGAWGEGARGNGAVRARADSATLRLVLSRYLLGLSLRAAGFVLLVAVLVQSFAAAASGGGSAEYVGAAIGAFAVANLVGRVAVFAPAGLGVRDLTLVAVLAPVIGLPVAGLAAVIIRVADALAELLVLGGTLMMSSPMPPGTLLTGESLDVPGVGSIRVAEVTARTPRPAFAAVKWQERGEGSTPWQSVWDRPASIRRDPPSSSIWMKGPGSRLPKVQGLRTWWRRRLP